MIIELEPPEPRESVRAWLPPVLGALGVLWLLMSLAGRPAVAPAAAPATTQERPRAAAFVAAPMPRRLPVLPAHLGRQVSRPAVAGVTGLASAVATEGGDIQVVFWLVDGREVRLIRAPRDDAFVLPNSYTSEAVVVRGSPGLALTAKDARLASIVTWSDAWATFQLSSRAVETAELVRLANALRWD